MATSGSFTSSFGTNSAYKFIMEWKRTATNVANNTSTVSFTLYMQSTGSSYTINSSVTKNGSITINGTTYTFTFSAALSGNQKKQIYTKSVTIAHNSDGTKSFTVSAKGTIGISFSSGKVNDINVSGTVTLDTIPRTSSFSLNTTNATLGSTSVTVTISRASTSFTHKVYTTFGSNTTTHSSSAGTSVSFTPAIGLCSQVPNATSGTATVHVETYSGSTKIGTASKTMTYTVPTSVVPTISSLGAAVVASGAATSYGYVQGKSKCQLTINSPAGSYGSTIKSYKITGNGGTWTTSSTTTGVLNTSGNITFSATVTDSRGRTSAAKSVTISVQAYSNPTISAFSASRTTSAGSASDTGTYITASATYACTSLGGKNTVSGTLEYKKSTTTTWTAGGSLATGKSATIGGGGIATENIYDVRITVKDAFTSVSKTAVVKAAFATIDFRNGGKGVAIGKFSAGNVFEVAMNQHLSGQLLPASTNTYTIGSANYRWSTIYAVNALNTSDIKYKENIVPVNEQAARTYALRNNDVTLNDMRNFVRDDCNIFKYNYKGQDHEEFGFIAQDIAGTKVGQKLLLGNEEDKGGYAYSIGSYLGIVVGALQEEIRIRDNEIEQLNNTLSLLEERLSKLEQEMGDE